MNRIINFKFFAAILAVLALGLTGCYEEPDRVGELVEPGRGHFPVISTLVVSNGSDFARGETATLDMRFFSDDPIENITLSSIIDGVETEVATFGYTPNFQEDSQTDQLLMDYVVPTDLAADITSVELKVVILNKNELTRERTVTINIV